MTLPIGRRAYPGINFRLQFRLSACACAILGLHTLLEYARLSSLRLGCEIQNFAAKLDTGIGSKSQRGFTLIELLLSIVILSAGLVVIDQILLASASSLSYVDNRTTANHLMANKIWEIGDQADRGKLFQGTEKGVMAAGDRKMDYQLKTFPAETGTSSSRERAESIGLRPPETGTSSSRERAESIGLRPPETGSPLLSMTLALQWEQTGRRKSISRSFYTWVRNEKKVE